MSDLHSKQFLYFILVLLLMFLVGCSSAVQPTPTPTVIPATDTPLPTPTKTTRPTSTPKPTATPNLAATQKVDDFYSVFQTFEEEGYIESKDGAIFELEPFEEEWAQIGWYRWVEYNDTVTDFLVKAHFKWSTASSTPETSGCGFVFGIQENGDHYSVFVDQSRILFLMKRGSKNYLVGKTSGSGRTDFSNPAEADFALAVNDQKAYVSVDGDFTVYTLSLDQTTTGHYGQTVLSGTNKDYGTRCEMSDVMMWAP